MTPLEPGKRSSVEPDYYRKQEENEVIKDLKSSLKILVVLAVLFLVGKAGVGMYTQYKAEKAISEFTQQLHALALDQERELSQHLKQQQLEAERAQALFQQRLRSQQQKAAEFTYDTPSERDNIQRCRNLQARYQQTRHQADYADMAKACRAAMMPY